MTDKPRSFRREIIGFAIAILLAACATGPSARPRSEAMVAAADPRAVEAGLQMIREGGTATDAAIAAMMVLGLVEPQSAGVGGGGFMVAYLADGQRIETFDGRERAPMGATPDMFLGPDGSPLPFRDAVASGRSIGTPSLIAMLKLAHDRNGRLPWAHLFAPAIELAEHGFVVSERFHNSLVRASGRLRDDPDARAYFFTENGEPLPVGFLRTNPAYAATLRAIAAQGPDALTHGAIADTIIAAAHREPRAGTLALSDLQSYRPRRLEPVCGAFFAYRVCGMGPPSSGGEAVLAILGLYQRARPTPGDAANPDDWAAFLWASRLAYADRDYYLADDTAVPVPTQALIDPRYLDARAQAIDLAHAPGAVIRGDPSTIIGGPSLAERWGRDRTMDRPGTTHMSIVDSYGNALAMTATIEGPYGSQRMASGFLLNNQLTDFSLAPTLGGQAVANAVAPGKRPRSSMAPTIVTDQQGHLVAVVGSPGGSGIIAYVARTLIGNLAWGQSMQAAISTGNVVASGPNARIETSRLAPGLQEALTARGWNLAAIQTEESGLHGIRVTPQGLDGGADPRREGVARALPAP